MSKIFIINGRSGSTLIDHILYHHGFKSIVPMGHSSTEAHELRLTVINHGSVQAWLKSQSHEWDYCKCCELGARIPEVLEVFPKAKFIIMDRDDTEMVRSNEAVGWGTAFKEFFINSEKWFTEVYERMFPWMPPKTENMSKFQASCYHLLYPKKKAYKNLRKYPYHFHVVSFQYLMGDFKTELKKLFVALDFDLDKVDWNKCSELRHTRLQLTARAEKVLAPTIDFHKRLFDLTSEQIRFIRSLQIV